MTASKQFSDEYLQYLTALIARLDRASIARFADLLLESRENETTTFFWVMVAAPPLQRTLSMMSPLVAGSLRNHLELLACVIIKPS